MYCCEPFWLWTRNYSRNLVKDKNLIIVQQEFDVSMAIFWKAITDVEQMRQWYFPNIPDFKPQIGFKTQFLIQNEGRNFTHIWTIKEVNAPHIIGYSWNFKEYGGEGYSTFVLTRVGEKTLLTLKSYVVEQFPEDIPEFKRESGQAGWNYLIKDSLVHFLNS